MLIYMYLCMYFNPSLSIGINLSSKLLKQLYDQPLVRNSHATAIYYSISHNNNNIQPETSINITQQQSLPPIDEDENLKYHEPHRSLLVFHPLFLSQVRQYHQLMSRPHGTFEITHTHDNEDNSVNNSDKTTNCNDNTTTISDKDIQHPVNDIETLANLPRDLCSYCHQPRHIYCGDCGSRGSRMSNAASYLPERVNLPFDVLLVVHWNETLHKCTGT